MLSKREKQILSLVCLSNKQIGEVLNISSKTVERYFADMFAKTHTSRRTELLLRAIEGGELKAVDLGFWNDKNEYIPDIQLIDLRKA